MLDIAAALDPRGCALLEILSQPNVVWLLRTDLFEICLRGVRFLGQFFRGTPDAMFMGTCAQFGPCGVMRGVEGAGG